MALPHIDTSPWATRDHPVHASCHCGWVSKRTTANTRKAWRQHVTRGTH